jgi:hypothetical protein
VPEENNLVEVAIFFFKYFYARFQDLTLSDSGTAFWYLLSHIIRIIEGRKINLGFHQSGMCRQHSDHQFSIFSSHQFLPEINFLPRMKKKFKKHFRLIY